jgi:hypothetical protein
MNPKMVEGRKPALTPALILRENLQQSWRI